MSVKICGVTTVEDALAAAACGAAAIGLNFYPPSPRFISTAQARAITAALPPNVRPVGVFVRPTPVVIRQTCSDTGMTTVQLYDADPACLRETIVGGRLSVILACGVGSATDATAAEGEVHCWLESGMPVEALLIDAQVRGQFGGTGQTVPWSLVAQMRVPVPLILAGGLTPENVGEAIHRARPGAVDVASGVEARLGRKDSEKLRQFVKTALEALAAQQTGKPWPVSRRDSV
jgi:phosphoribosylanthranilate isomerase